MVFPDFLSMVTICCMCMMMTEHSADHSLAAQEVYAKTDSQNVHLAIALANGWDLQCALAVF